MERNLAYDGLRGWLLIIISCNHLYGSFVPQILRSPLGLVSAAEGFVFLSGFVAYRVYSRFVSNEPYLWSKIWNRILVIYFFHITAVITSFILVWIFPVYTQHWIDFFGAKNWFDNYLQSQISALLLLEHPGYHDILIIYIIAMAFLPFAVKLIHNGKATFVAAASVLVWISAQFITADVFYLPYSLLFNDIKINVSYFDPFAWQIYFYTGVILSYLKFHKGYTYDFNPVIKFALLFCIFSIAIIKHMFPNVLVPYAEGQSEASIIFQVNLLLASYLVMLMMRSYTWFFTMKYPVFLGRHSLAVFSFHTVVIYFLQPWSQVYTTEKWYFDLLFCVFFITLLAIPAFIDEIWHTRRKA